MEIQQLYLKRKLSEQQGNALEQKFLGNDSFDTLLTNDADVYNAEGEMLLKFRKNIIPFELLKSGYDAFKGAIRVTTNRGSASGHRGHRVKKDGQINSKTTYGNNVESSIVGYMESIPRTPFCRKTAFTKQHFETFQQGVPFISFVDDQYRLLCPEHHAKQMAISRATNVNYRIADTSFTTVTVNRNFRTAVHKDAGDFPAGFGNLCVYREGVYDGLYFCLPEYGVAVDMQNTDLLFCDVHKWHGNTPLISEVPGWMRVSYVCYFREFMLTCKSPTDELAKVKQDRGGFLKL